MTTRATFRYKVTFQDKVNLKITVDVFLLAVTSGNAAILAAGMLANHDAWICIDVEKLPAMP